MAPPTSFDDPEYLEDVYAALFQQLIGATFPAGIALKNPQRVVVSPDDIPVAAQPTLLLFPGPMHVEQKEFALAKWTFTAVAVLYVRADGAAQAQDPLPATVANYLVWGLARALAPTTPPYQKQTLGGLVYHCWFEGDVIPEVQNEQMVLTMPILIEAGDIGDNA